MSSKHSLPMILATSLVPGSSDSQQQVNVASWKAAGFEVISINGAIEAQALKTAYPDVHVVVTEKTAERIANKPVPYIHDLLKALKVRCESQDIPLDQCIVGIINADIYLRATPALRTILQEQAQGALILGPRVDVSDGDALKSYVPTGTETYSIGYDYFLMSGDLLDDFAESPFAMGMPFWDYWLPLVTLLHGRPLKSLNSPVALHVHHETRWDDTIYLFFHSLVAYVIELCRKTVGQNQSPAARQFDFLFDVLSHTYGGVLEKGTAPGEASSTPDATGVATLADFYDRFQGVVVHHIKSRAETITAPEA